ncbi:MAG: hypothetical protein NUV49_04125, partial [Patescibacteria group bacterium]|nr:hypothetical protein [Patescibacteria group bacterium]
MSKRFDVIFFGSILGALLVLLVGSYTSASPSFGLATLVTVQGGTGTSTPSGILYGDNGATGQLKTVTIGSNITFSGGTLSATGGSGVFMWTPTDYGISTSTIVGFTGGLLSAASSTFSGDLHLQAATSTDFAITNLTNSLLSTNADGSVVATSTIGTNLLTANTISGVALGSNLNAL